ncbi:hypothetical protein TNCV_4774221 [Trichonephila clavipes]|nr:hypothetical protein TNCV_4774221 [Trichonephila clavipes]
MVVCHEFESSVTEDPPCRGADAWLYVEAQMSSHCCNWEVRRGGSQLTCRPRLLTMFQNYEIRRQKPSSVCHNYVAAELRSVICNLNDDCIFLQKLFINQQ